MHSGETDAAETGGDLACCSLKHSRDTAVEDAGEASVLQHASEPADAADVSDYGPEVLAFAPNAERDGREGARDQRKIINNALGVAPAFSQHRSKPVGLGKRSNTQSSLVKKHRKSDMNDSDSDSDDDEYRTSVPMTEVETRGDGEA